MAENMFIGQGALLQWLNSTLGLKLEKIEEVSGPCRRTQWLLGARAGGPLGFRGVWT